MLRLWRSFAASLAAVLLASSTGAGAQVIEVPRPAPGQPIAPEAAPYFDDAHLKDRPYSFTNPKPAFPSTDRVQREFVVEYLYEYALSRYTPAVRLPVIPRVQMKRDTPENSLIALYSAMRNGDFDAWVQCWDAAGQKRLLDDARTTERTGAFWARLWKQVLLPNNDTTLIDRVETDAYIILDAAISGPRPLTVPSVFKLVEGQWLATNDLASNPLVYVFNPTLAGAIYPVPPIPVERLDKNNPQQIEAQQQFLNDHMTRTRVAQAGQTVIAPLATSPAK